MAMKKYLFGLFTLLLITACSSEDPDVEVTDTPSYADIQPTDESDSLSVYTKEAAKRLTEKWKMMYTSGWTPNSLEIVETDCYSYVQFYDDHRYEIYNDTLPWSRTLAAEALKRSRYMGYGYRVCDDWSLDEATHKLYGHIIRDLWIDSCYNYSGYGHRYYCSFGENDSYEMYIIEDPEDGINCFGWGCGYVRVE
jgi:hypothetical protein